MKSYEAVEWHDKKADEWEKMRIGIGNFTLEKQNICIRELYPKKNEKILDVGCGTGFFASKAAKRQANIIGLDMSENMLKVAEKIAKKNNLKIKFIKGNAEKLPFKNCSFDKVIAVDLIGHLPNPQKFIKEVGRVIKNGGKFILAWPYSKSPYRIKYYFEKYILKKNLPFTKWLSVNLVEKWLRYSSFKTKRIRTSFNITIILVCEKI